MRPVVVMLALGAVGCTDEAVYPALLESRSESSLVFANPEEDCVECHPDHVAEWRISNHAYGSRDPVFVAMVQMGQHQTRGKLGQFCIQCHAPAAMALGKTPVFYDEVRKRYNQRIKTLTQTGTLGVSCDVCHSITEIIAPLNAQMVTNPNGVQRGPIESPVANEAHESLHDPAFAKSEICAPCHAVTNPRGALIEQTFAEWTFSSFPSRGKECQTCHMPQYRGRAAPDAPERDLHRHVMVGVDVSLLPEDQFPGYHELRALAAEMLRSSAEFSLTYQADAGELVARIVNLAGHALPSGATADRQLWIELTVTDADGEEVFVSGTLDANGDIRDAVAKHNLAPGTDPHLAYFGQQMLFVPAIDGVDDPAALARLRAQTTAACLPIGVGVTTERVDARPVTFPWQANWQCDFLVPPDGAAEHEYPMGTLAPGEYTARARLFFRTFPPHMLRRLEEVGGLDPAVKGRVPTVKIAEALVRFDVDP